MKVFFIFFFCGCANVTYPISDHCDGSRFFNSDPGARALPGLGALFKWRLTSKPAVWPTSVDAEPAADLSVPIAPGAVRVTMVNHATQLIQLSGLTVLTDPVYSERASPVGFAGPKRVCAPGVPMEALPHIDAVVLSHNHYDHLDLNALRSLWERYHPMFYVPLGNSKLLRSVGITQVSELDWWEDAVPLPGTRITLTEAQHWSARGLTDRNLALWGGYVIAAGGAQVFFAGDTGYGPHFKKIRAKLGRMDAALLPIGAYEPRWFMKNQHMNPDDAVEAHLDLEARYSVGIHFGTFQLTDEGRNDPPEDLAKALSSRGVDKSQFKPLLNGQALLIPAVESR